MTLATYETQERDFKKDEKKTPKPQKGQEVLFHSYNCQYMGQAK